jgi:hypothetical protein
MSISRAFDPPTPGPLSTSVAQSVQSSLYQRLRKTYKDRAGDVGWLLVRLGQPDHREHDEACQAVNARSLADITAFLAVVRAAPRSRRTPAADDLVRAIADVLELAAAAATMRGSR